MHLSTGIIRNSRSWREIRYVTSFLTSLWNICSRGESSSDIYFYFMTVTSGSGGQLRKKKRINDIISRSVAGRSTWQGSPSSLTEKKNTTWRVAVNHKQVYCRNDKLLMIIARILKGNRNGTWFSIDTVEERTVTGADFLGRSPINGEVSVWDGKSRKILNFTA